MATLATAREFLERELVQSRSRADVHLIGERICEVIELQELDEQRMLRTPTVVCEELSMESAA